jgi:exosome complex component RRP40
MTTERQFVLPGDPIDHDLIPKHQNRPLKLGPGLRFIPPSQVVPTKAGELVADARKNSIWVDHPGGRVRDSPSNPPRLLTRLTGSASQYLPTTGDFVIGTVRASASDIYYVSIAEYYPNAILPQLSFEMATKKSRPMLGPGAVVYARVSLANKYMDTELECVSPSTGKADGLGPLAGGMVFSISLGMARRLLMARSVEDGKVVVLQELETAGAAFETAVGRNGRIWVDSASAKTIIALGRAITETDEKNLNVEMQKKLVRKLIKDLS